MQNSSCESISKPLTAKEVTLTKTLNIACELQRAANALSQVCDGAVEDDGMGYNACDTSFGKYIAAVDPSEWDDEICFVVHRMLKKYQEQLESYDIIYDELPRPEVKWEKAPKRGDVSKRMKSKAARADCLKELQRERSEGGGALNIKNTFKKVMMCGWSETHQAFELVSPKDWDLVNRIKEAKYKDRKWTGMAWLMSGAGLLLLPAILNDFDFVITDEDRKRLDKMIKKVKVELAEKASKPQVWIEGDVVVTKTDYHPDLVQVMQNIQGRKWRGRDGGPKDENTFPLNVIAGRQILEMVEQFNLRVADGVKGRLEDLGKAAAERVSASNALDADLDIEGFGTDELVPYPFQKGGIKYAMGAKNTFIADEMGLGKTVQALGTLQATNTYPALVIVPKGVNLQWVREAGRWLPGRSCQLVRGTKPVEYTAEIVVINYDILLKHLPGLLERPWKAIVLDESHYIKNRKAQRTAAAMALSALDSLEVRLCLTGTPVLNRPIELVQQLTFLGTLNDMGGFWHFAKRFCDAHEADGFWDMNGASNLEELSKRLRATCFVRREKADVIKELPPLQRTVVPVELDNLATYEAALADVISWMRSKKADGSADADKREYTIEALAKIEGLKQLVVEHKFNSCVEWISSFLDSDGKLVVFAHHRNVQDKLAAALADYNPARIVGAMNDEARKGQIDKFRNDDSCRVAIVSLKAGGTGIDGLQIASSVAFVEFGWHPGEMDQAEARVHRIGSDEGVSAVNSYWLGAEDTFDDDIIGLIEEKRVVTEAINAGREIEGNVDIVSWFEMLTGVEEK